MMLDNISLIWTVRVRRGRSIETIITTDDQARAMRVAGQYLAAGDFVQVLCQRRPVVGLDFHTSAS